MFWNEIDAAFVGSLLRGPAARHTSRPKPSKADTAFSSASEINLLRNVGIACSRRSFSLTLIPLRGSLCSQAKVTPYLTGSDEL